MKALLLILACAAFPAFAATTYTEGGWTLQSSTGNQSATSLDDCKAKWKALPAPLKQRTDYCRQQLVTKIVTAPPPPPPIDCIVSDWSPWTPTNEWSACVNGQQTRTEQHARSIVTGPANGGAACPALSETRQAVQPCTSPPPTTDADAIWKAMSTGDGVSAAYGFDSQAEVTRGYQPGANGVRGFWDMNVKHSGAGSLRLEARAGDTGALISGQWGLPSNTLGRGYGPSSDMWLHFAYRADAGFVAARKDWNSNPKVISIYSGSVPCQALELTLVWPIVGTTLYTQCGNNLSTATTSPKGQNNVPPYLYQQSFDLAVGGSAREPNGVQSAYPNPPAFQFIADTWTRVLFHVKRSSGGDSVEAWGQADGGPWVKFVAWQGRLQSSGNGSLDNAVLMNYMTGLSSRSSRAGNIWYDEFAISEKPFPIILH